MWLRDGMVISITMKCVKNDPDRLAFLKGDTYDFFADKNSNGEGPGGSNGGGGSVFEAPESALNGGPFEELSVGDAGGGDGDSCGDSGGGGGDADGEGGDGEGGDGGGGDGGQCRSNVMKCLKEYPPLPRKKW